MSEKEQFEIEVNILKTNIQIINERINLYKRTCIGIIILISFILITIIRILLYFSN